MANVILLKGNPLKKEGVAGGTITPGHLIERSAGTVIVHATAAGNAAPRFAVENSDAGNGIDVDYSASDQVHFIQARSGDEINALVAAAAAAISEGDALESAGDGTLRVQTAAAATSEAQRDSVVAYALEAVDNSAGGSPVRIKVEAR